MILRIVNKKKQIANSRMLSAFVRIHGQCFHQQAVAEAFVAENFMGIIGGHWCEVIELSLTHPDCASLVDPPCGAGRVKKKGVTKRNVTGNYRR
jgi:hypothetical protein